MKKIIVSTLILTNLCFGIQPCEDGVDACAHLYQTPLTKEIKVTNMKHKPIIFSIRGNIGTESKIVRNRILQPYQTYTLIKKQYRKREENEEQHSYTFSAEIYNPKIKQNIELKYW